MTSVKPSRRLEAQPPDVLLFISSHGAGRCLRCHRWWIVHRVFSWHVENMKQITTSQPGPPVCSIFKWKEYVNWRESRVQRPTRMRC